MPATGKLDFQQLWLQSLVLRSQAGDDRAFADLVAVMDGRVRRYVAGLFFQSAEREDLVQEIWITVHQKLFALRDSGCFEAWLRRIARDKVYSYCRRHRHSLWPDAAAVVLENDPEPAAWDEAELERLLVCLERLNERHQRLLKMKFWERLSYAAIAREIGCKLGTIRSRLHYAKKALRREMEKLCHETDH